MIPVTGQLVQLTLSHVWRFCEQPAAFCFLVLDKALQYLNDLGALREQYRQSLPYYIDRCKILKLSAYLIVVALLCKLNLFEVFLKLGRLREGCAVYTLEHFFV